LAIDFRFHSAGTISFAHGKGRGYNHLKQLGVGSTIAGQLIVGAIGGAILGLCMRRNAGKLATLATISVFVALPLIAAAIALWPVLGTSLRWVPIAVAASGYARRFSCSAFLFSSGRLF